MATWDVNWWPWGQCHGLEAVRLIQTCRGDGACAAAVITVRDAGDRTLRVPTWRAMAGSRVRAHAGSRVNGTA